MRWTLIAAATVLLVVIVAFGSAVALDLRSSAPFIEFRRTALASAGWPAPSSPEALVREHGRDTAWRALGSATPIPGLAEDARQGAAAVLYLTASPGDEEAILAAVDAQQLGARPAGLMLSAVWHLAGTDPRPRIAQLLAGSPTEVALALHALPLLTGVRLVDSLAAPLVLPRDPRTPAQVVDGVFGLPPAALANAWQTWLRDHETTSFATARTESLRALLDTVDLSDPAFFATGSGPQLARAFRTLPSALPVAGPDTASSTHQAELEHWLSEHREACDGPAPPNFDPRALLNAHRR